MNSPVTRFILPAAVSAALILGSARAAPAADRAPAREQPGLSTAVRPGESWEALRDRMFPLRALKQTNPGLDANLLHPGQIVQAPYVRASALALERTAREEAERGLAEARAHVTDLEAERAGFEAQRDAFARAGDSMRALQNLVFGLIAFTVALLVGLGVALQVARAARGRAAEAESRRQDIEYRHASLRRSLAELETGLQRRMMGLLHLHGGKIITEKELDASVRPVIDLAGELRKKHERA